MSGPELNDPDLLEDDFTDRVFEDDNEWPFGEEDEYPEEW